ncbi:GNAT family N-acetyltransferase [Trinickia dinghuensis]|uniref:GNAT family N-acetyltransferase n=1 Tax=Trinickia dinghuensis TaxID=2291023 RepID=UPI001FEBFCBE|nr:GNAT family N-acetyltransferase [Trinickia dinghuensis]
MNLNAAAESARSDFTRRQQRAGRSTPFDAPNAGPRSRHLHRRRKVATIRQLAVDPDWHRCGVGKALLAFAEHWAATHGYDELAFDTPYPATHRVSFYRANGFRLVDRIRFAGKVYDSAIFSKATVVARTFAAWTHRAIVPGADMLRIAA